MQIKSVIIDNIYHINFVTFKIITFFLDLPCWNWGASYTPVYKCTIWPLRVAYTSLNILANL